MPKVPRSKSFVVIRMVVVSALGTALVMAIGLQIPVWLIQYDDVQRLKADRGPLSPDNPPSQQSFSPLQVVPRPALVSGVKYVGADEIGPRLQDEDLVLAVTIGNESRAWPINMLTGPQREIINDVVGGRAIAATW